MRRLFSKRRRLKQVEWDVAQVQSGIIRLHEVDEKIRRSITELARRASSLETTAALLESQVNNKVDVDPIFVATKAQAYVNNSEASQVWVEPELIQADIIIEQGMNAIVFRKTTTLEELNSFIASIDLSKHQTIKLTDSARPGELLVVSTKDIRKIWTQVISEESTGDHS